MGKISESSRKGYSCLMYEKKVTNKTVSVTNVMSCCCYCSNFCHNGGLQEAK